MSSIDVKLIKFKETSSNMAIEESNILSDQINQEIEKNIYEEVLEYEKEKSREHTKKMERLEQKHNSDIFQTENNARYEVLKKENELQEKFYNKITSRIKEFVDGKEYSEFLNKNIKQTITNLNIEDGDNVLIKITKKDWDRFAKELKAMFDINFETIDDSNFGGSIGINSDKQILIDNTLKTQIAELVD